MKVGFIGLGTMGGSMSLNIRKAGYEMIVNDLRPEVGARQIEMGCQWSDSVGAVAAAADVLFTSLPGPPEVEAVALAPDGLLASMKPGSVWFDLSTNSPSLVRRLHARFADAGIEMLDAPVSGGPAGAASGKLAIWVGGSAAAFETHKALLDAFSDQASYIGESGAGAIAKLCHNMASSAISTALIEVFSMGVKAGLPAIDLWEAVRQGAAGRRRSFDGLAANFFAHEFDPPAFALKLSLKDVTLATEVGREIGVPMRLCNLVREEMTEALNRGWGGRDSRTALLLQEERAGVEVKATRAEVAAVFDRDAR
jgi:3-hydroxyisobutyrate dehydrogenase